MRSIRIVDISGSLRAESWNTLALRTAWIFVPSGMTAEIFEALREVLPYDDDLRTGSGYLQVAEALHARLRAADAA